MVEQMTPFLPLIVTFSVDQIYVWAGLGTHLPWILQENPKAFFWEFLFSESTRSEPRADNDEKWGQGLLPLLRHLVRSRHEVTSFRMDEWMSRGMGFMEYDTGWSRCPVLLTLLVPAAFLLPCFASSPGPDWNGSGSFPLTVHSPSLSREGCIHVSMCVPVCVVGLKHRGYNFKYQPGNSYQNFCALIFKI